MSSVRKAFASIAVGLFALTTGAAGQTITSAAPPGPDPRDGLRAPHSGDDAKVRMLQHEVNDLAAQ